MLWTTHLFDCLLAFNNEKFNLTDQKIIKNKNSTDPRDDYR